MMKLSHESKVRLGVGIGAFVLIIGLVFGTSRLLAHSDMVRTTGILSGDLSDFDDMFDDDDLLDDGSYSARPQQLSSATFDDDALQSLDLDVASGSVEIKHVSGGPVRVIESGRIANELLLPMRRPRTLPKSTALRSRSASSTAMTSVR